MANQIDKSCELAVVDHFLISPSVKSLKSSHWLSIRKDAKELSDKS